MKKVFGRILLIGASLVLLSGVIASVDAMGLLPGPKPPPFDRVGGGDGGGRRSPTPEPATLGLLGAGIAGAGAYFIAKRKNRK